MHGPEHCLLSASCPPRWSVCLSASACHGCLQPNGQGATSVRLGPWVLCPMDCMWDLSAQQPPQPMCLSRGHSWWKTVPWPGHRGRPVAGKGTVGQSGGVAVCSLTRELHFELQLKMEVLRVIRCALHMFRSPCSVFSGSGSSPQDCPLPEDPEQPSGQTPPRGTGARFCSETPWASRFA